MKAVFDGFAGLHAQSWLVAARRLRTERKTNRKLTEAVVFKAIKAIERINDAAKTRVGLIASDWSAARLQNEEDNLFVGFRVSEDEAPTVTSSDSFGMVLSTSSAKVDDVGRVTEVEPVSPLRRRRGDDPWIFES